ncbi:MAG: HIT family hydrolase [Deltaproteobacteria bacterium]|nr:MAG: HIT family hydrolase [Deltaproteobacteria bacterium]
MKTLWNPWREQHVLDHGKKYDFCIFEPPTTASYSKKHLLLYQDRNVVVLLNRFPYANGHLLVAPPRHIADISELLPAENTAIMAMLQQSADILRQHLHCDGLNIGCNLGKTAGAGIAGHLHFHVVPRWEGDHNFITVVGEVRTIPIHIERTFDQLVPDFQQFHHRQNR